MHCHENAAYLKFKLNQFSVFATAVKKWKRCTNNQQKEKVADCFFAKLTVKLL
jgi:hypothetical protein